MLYLIPYFIYAMTLLYVYGMLPFIFFKQNIPQNPFVVFVVGFAVLGFMSLLFWVGGPVNYFCFWVMVFGALVALVLNREYYKSALFYLIRWFRQQAYLEKIAIGLLLIPILYQSAQAPKINDMGMYYLQTMQWMHNYGLVPGLANLHPALGLGSAWHNLVVLLDPFSIGLNHYWQLNGVLLFVFILFCWFEMKQNSAIYLRIVFILSLPVSFLYLTAPSPDLPVILLSGILFYTVWFVTGKIHWFTLLLLCVFIFACKPPAFLAVLMAFVVFISVKSAKKRILFIFFGVILCSVILYKNYVLSGYLLYPYSKPDVIDVSWKVPADWNAAYTKGIVSWGLRDKLDLGDKWEMRNGIWEMGNEKWDAEGKWVQASNKYDNRLWIWLKRGGYKGFMNKLIFLNFLFGLGNLLMGLWHKKVFSKDYLVLMALLFIEVIEWLMLSQYRLMLPSCLVLTGFNFYLIANLFTNENTWLSRVRLSFKSLVIYSCVLFYGMAFIPFSIFAKESRNKTITRLDGFNNMYLVEPYEGFIGEKTDSILSDSIYIHFYPNQTYCWDCVIPCVSISHRNYLFNNFGYRLKPLGIRVTDGFRLGK